MTAAESTETSDPSQFVRSGWSMRTRIFLQVMGAVLPLVALLIYETHSENLLLREVNARLNLAQLASSAVDNYREFINGVTDAADTGQLAPAARVALHQTLDSLHQLAAIDSSPELRTSIDDVTRVDAAVGADSSMKGLLTVRKDINDGSAQIKATASAIQTELATRLVKQRAQDERQSLVSTGMATATLMVLIWVLRRTVMQIAEPISIAVNVAKRVTAGDLTGEIEVRRRDEFGELLSALMRMHFELSEIVAEVRRGSVQIADASQHIADGTDDLARRTERQAEGVAQISTSAQQLRQSVNENASESEKANAVAREATVIATRGGEIVGRVVQTMQSIHAGSKQVVDFIGVIENIAFQTNILAINAAVEAARAGESGRGFAVVATEVRDLANRSARTAKDAKELIGRTFTHVNDGTRFVEQAGGTMTDIIAAVRSLADTTEAVLTASRRQQSDADAVADTAQQIDGMTRANSDFVRDSEAAAAGLRERAKSLNQTVDRFKVLRHVRLTVNWVASLIHAHAEASASVRSISVNGIGFESSTQLDVGQNVLLRLQLPAGGSVMVEASLAWCNRPGQSMPFAHGGRLLRVAQSGRSELRQWLAAELSAERQRSQELRANFDGLPAFDRLPLLDEMAVARASSPPASKAPALRRSA
jgi:methyl-accepting chemotaxis protein